MRDKTINKYS